MLHMTPSHPGIFLPVPVRRPGLVSAAIAILALCSPAACTVNSTSHPDADAASSLDARPDASVSSDAEADARIPLDSQADAETPDPMADCTLWVDANAGSDSAPGTRDAPFATIQHAAAQVSPGDIVCVQDGTYTAESTSDRDTFNPAISGTEASWVTFRAVHRWGAVLDGQMQQTFVLVPKADLRFVRFEGFHIRRSLGTCVHINWGENHHLVFHGNRISECGRIVDCCGSYDGGGRPCDGKCGAYVGGSAHDITFDSNVFDHIGRLPSDPLNCGGDHNHDHGLYLVGNNIDVINNIFLAHEAGWGIQLSGYYGPDMGNDIRVVNNTFAFPNPGRKGHIIIWGRTRNLLIENNIFYQPNGVAIHNTDCEDKVNVLIGSNLTDAESMIEESCDFQMIHNVTMTAPLFVNDSAASPDVHLQAGSPAIDSGSDTNAPPVDADGEPRPTGAVDIGAYEFLP